MPGKQMNRKTKDFNTCVHKYRKAGEIVNNVLLQIIKKCQAESSVRKICQFGDARVIEETSKVFKKTKNGLAFPTCVSINNCICHFSPIPNDPDVILHNGDLIKIELGAHIDGCIALVCHSLVIGASPTNIVEGRKADVLLAAHYASEAALHMLKPGNEICTMRNEVWEVCKNFMCKPIEGILSQQVQFSIENFGKVIQDPNEPRKKEHEKHELQKNKVYVIDVVMSTGKGVVVKIDQKTNIFKKTNKVFLLKTKASRKFLSQVFRKYGSLPFSLRGFEDKENAKIGAIDCVKNHLLEPFHILYENPDELVARFKFTVLLLPNGNIKITGLPFDTSHYKSDHVVSDTEKPEQVLQTDKSDEKKNLVVTKISNLLSGYDVEVKLRLFDQVMKRSDWESEGSIASIYRSIFKQIKQSSIEELLTEVKNLLSQSPYDLVQASLKTWEVVAGVVKVYLLRQDIYTVTYDGLSLGVLHFVEHTEDKKLTRYGMLYWGYAIQLCRYHQFGSALSLCQYRTYVKNIEELITGITSSTIKKDFVEFVKTKEDYNVQFTNLKTLGSVTLFNKEYSYRKRFSAFEKPPDVKYLGEFNSRKNK